MEFRVFKAESSMSGKGERFFIDAGTLDKDMVKVLMLPILLENKEAKQDPVGTLETISNAIESGRGKIAIRLGSDVDQAAAEDWSKRLTEAYRRFQVRDATIVQQKSDTVN